MATSSKTSQSSKATQSGKAAPSATAASARTPVKKTTPLPAGKPAKTAGATTKVPAKKSTAVKPAITKPAITKPTIAKVGNAPVKTPLKKTAKPASPKISAEQRRHYIEVAAYFIAERNGFSTESVLDHWIQAEAEIDRLLKEGKLNP